MDSEILGLIDKPKPEDTASEVIGITVKPSKNPDSWVYPIARTMHDFIPNSITGKIMERHGGDYTPEEIKKLWITDLFHGMEDNANDHFKDHPDYEKMLKLGKFYDKIHFPFLVPVGAINSQITNTILEHKKEQNKNKAN